MSTAKVMVDFIGFSCTIYCIKKSVELRYIYDMNLGQELYNEWNERGSLWIENGNILYCAYVDRRKYMIIKKLDLRDINKKWIVIHEPLPLKETQLEQMSKTQHHQMSICE